jgi:uncharacterized SAM-binding protein YcdF (DUF218 family)
MLVIFFCFLLIVILCALRWSRQVSTIMAVLTMILFFGVGSGFPARCLLAALQKPFINSKPIVWKHRNAIVVLGVGTIRLNQNIIKPSSFAYGRIVQAAELYFSCKKTGGVCVVITSGADVLRTGQTEAAVYANELKKLDVDRSDIIEEDKSLNTYQNAQFVKEIFARQPFDYSVLVTSGFHLMRAMRYFEHFKLYPVPVLSDYVMPISYTSLFLNFYLTELALHEYVGLFRFTVYDALGWSHPSS